MTRTSLPSRSLPVKGFEDPFAMLEACHGKLLGTLDLLARLRTHMKQHGADAQAKQAAGDIARYFDRAAPAHHLDEELHLFPRLRQLRQPALDGVVDRLQRDHAEMDAAWGRLGSALRGIASGTVEGLSPALEAELEAFAGLQAGHVETEEQLAYPAVKSLIDPEALARMGDEMRSRRGC